MNYQDHLPPHFHVRYNEFQALVAIESLAIIEGSLPPRVVGLVLEWALAHRVELAKDWELALQKKPLVPIEPLV